MLICLQQFLSKNIRRLNFRKTDCFSSSQAAILVFIISFFSTSGVVWRLEQQRLRLERAKISDFAADYSNIIQQKVERTLSVTYALAALVHQYQGVIPNFSKVAEDLLPLYPGAYALGLFPDGLEEAFVTLEEKSIVIEGDELESFNHLAKYLNSKNSPQNNLSVSLSLIDKFPGALGYLPVTLSTNKSNYNFWGFTTVTISFPELLQDIHLEELEEKGFAYQLQCSDNKTKQQEIIATSSTSIMNQPVEENFQTSQVNWTLSLTPIAGWFQPISLSLKLLLGMLFSFLLATLVKLFVDSKVHAFELENLAYFDSLTSLPNRRFLIYRLDQIIAQAQRNSKNVAICYLDLDDFSLINTRLGSKAGDYLLVRIAKRLQKFLRANDVIARIGGDKFVIVLQDLSCVEEVELILQRIIEAVTSPIAFDTEIISVFTSIGVTMYPQDNNSVDTLLNNANNAMLYTKKHNKGSYTLFLNLDRAILQSSPNQV